MGRALTLLGSSLRVRVEEFTQGNPSGMVEVFVQRSACLDREVRVWPKNTTDAAQTPSLVTGRLSGIDADLSIRVGGVSVAGGRLAFAEDCARFGL